MLRTQLYEMENIKIQNKITQFPIWRFLLNTPSKLTFASQKSSYPGLQKNPVTGLVSFNQVNTLTPLQNVSDLNQSIKSNYIFSHKLYM